MPDLTNFRKNGANDAKNAPRSPHPKPSLDGNVSELAEWAEKGWKSAKKCPKMGENRRF
jgi:hypothetical protein